MKKGVDSTAASAWFAKGEGDLRAAEIILKEPYPPTDTICFHCQQAAEKYLKGYLVSRDVSFFREHDLIYLLDLCREKEPAFSDLEEAANTLNDYAVETRYPFEDPIVYTVEESRTALKLANQIKDFVLKQKS